MPYNLIKIRELLLEAFSAEELTTFCQDYFVEAVQTQKVGSGVAMEVRARELIGYCERREQMPELLKHIQEGDSATRVDESTFAASSRPVRRHIYQESESPCLERITLALGRQLCCT